ncbi:hypothetical protein P691DRAFT_522334 [Macrolepiota fuliginosa MF-IS2]|uniref:Uncharacterized protein n=1 Tax=Macrolepiota fuliginosa MF-IS2 TaxID=1400762 RepID=A0A9P5XN79_9AGAR|nr:hypothetical protein P691DRAFT_522334 [Macrolepiota fuliginosa MF-IS2]
MEQLSSMPGGLPESSPHIGELPNKPFSTPTSPQPTTLNFAAPSSTKGKGLQLGGTTKAKSNNNAIADFARELEDDLSAPGGDNPWGNDDLMDVNADEDDWSAFETAPIPSSPTPPIAQPQPTRLTTSSNILNGGSSHNIRKASSSLSPPTAVKSKSAQRAVSPAPSSHQSTPVQPGWDDTNDWGKVETASSIVAGAMQAPTATPMTKEEKAAEMARRKEERKQRIAMLKEQKKNAAKAP